ncbi:MAG: tetratricopeptide repeat protein, partial [Anaerolineae bacterium]|nr:tetratricopeptide repeat protein [Anaerolineae bacterium]
LADLTALADRSLLHRDPGGRYGLHEVLRAYAAEKLSLSPEPEREARARHSAYYLDLIADAGEGLKGREQRATLSLLEREVPNLQQAWQRALEAGDWERARRALPNWILFMEMGPRKRESGAAALQAIAAVRGAAAARGPTPTLNAILALLLAAWRYHSTSLEPGTPPGPLIEESMALARSLPDCPEKAMVYLLNCVGSAPDNPAGAVALAGESLAVFDALGDRWGTAMARLVLGDCLVLGANDCDAARSAYGEARAAFRALGNRWGEAMCLVGLTMVASRQGHHGEAMELGRESLAVYRDLGNPWRIVTTLELLAQVAREAGDPVTARACLEESLAPLEETGHRAAVAGTLVHLARAARGGGDLAGAREYLERARMLCQELGDLEGAERVGRDLLELAAEGSP